MKHTSWRWRRSFATTLVAGMVWSTAAVAGPSSALAEPGTGSAASVLGEHDADLLTAAEEDDVTSVTLIMATETGRAADVANAVDALGGSVARQFEKTGYVLASVPTEKAVAAAKLSGVAAADIDEMLALPDPRIDAKPDEKALQSVPNGPGSDTMAANPFLPTNETGAVAFRQQNPTSDGRGVTIGIMDSGIDLDHPALQKTSTGERKIVDWVTATDPIVDGDGSWLAMVTKVTGPSFTYQNASWKAPRGRLPDSQVRREDDERSHI